jgi:hypothetical protein
MTFNGSKDPCAVINMGSIGFKRTPHEVTQDLGPFVCEAFGIPKER